MSSDKKKKFAQDARNFVTLHRAGVLSTLSVSQNGFPFGSIVPYDVTPSGEIVIYISLIAEHYKNINADSRASLIIVDPFGMQDPQAYARATVLLNFERVPEAEVQATQKSYEERFPNSINYEIQHNFLFMRARPVKVRWIGGFGDIAWVDGNDFCESAPDTLAYHALDIINHMNDDHYDALVDFAKAQGPFDEKKSRLCMNNVDEKGFTIAVRNGEKTTALQIPFRQAVSSPDDVRREIIALLKDVRQERHTLE